MSNETEKEYLLDIALSKQQWVNEFMKVLESSELPVWVENEKAFLNLKSVLNSDESKDAAIQVLNEMLSGFAHSVLVGLDGGTQLAEKYTITLNTSEGDTLCNYLHELWPEAEEEFDEKYKQS